ncbi:hypothetical protein LTR84_009279 [Exophiala bonariae]|uniref:CFEM domain-containing protein n=1 Tax=Exophiala bonariae TaxID=1690606 RepID=A0AAV9MX08_9EURO|nr:hypothetical protein LTR84_009279 [Exophiala bonariae]
MQLSIILSTTILAAVVSAQSLTDIPACATTCITDALPASCNLDPSCICHTASFIDGIACCIFTACNTTDQQAALAFAHGVCDPVGASSLLPASAGCSSTSGSGNGTASATGSATTTGSGSSSATTTAASGSNALSSASASISSRASSASSAASASAASATSTPAGSADRLAVQGLGAVGAAVLGLAAFL